MRPLLMAAWHGHLEAVKTLVGAGACLAATNKVCAPCICVSFRTNHCCFLLIFFYSWNKITVISFRIEELSKLSGLQTIWRLQLQPALIHHTSKRVITQSTISYNKYKYSVVLKKYFPVFSSKFNENY